MEEVSKSRVERVETEEKRKEIYKRRKCFFFELPRDLYNMICSEYLKLEDIVNLDISVSATEYRCSIWMEQLKSRTMLPIFYNFIVYSIHCWKFYNWIYLRNIVLSKYHISNEIVPLVMG